MTMRVSAFWLTATLIGMAVSAPSEAEGALVDLPSPVHRILVALGIRIEPTAELPSTSSATLNTIGSASELVGKPSALSIHWLQSPQPMCVSTPQTDGVYTPLSKALRIRLQPPQ